MKGLTLAEQAVKNPFRFFTVEEVGEIYGFGRNMMTRLLEAGAPTLARKINPHLLMEWLRAHPNLALKAHEE